MSKTGKQYFLVKYTYIMIMIITHDLTTIAADYCSGLGFSGWQASLLLTHLPQPVAWAQHNAYGKS